MESGPHFSFFWVSEPGTGAGRAYRRDVELSGSHFSFFGGSSGSLHFSVGFSFFWVSEPGTGARPSLQKMWREKGDSGGSTALFFFFGFFTENVEREGDRDR